MKKLFSLFMCAVMLICYFSLTAVAQDEQPQLSFGADGKFTVLHLTDPQDDAVLADELVGFIEKSIEVTQPDLIVITGDIVEDSRAGDISDSELFKEGVTVDGDYDATLANARSAVAQMFAPLEASGVPYAVTQGNNDYNSEVTLEDWMKIYSEYPGCLTGEYCDMLSGRVDFYLPVFSSSGYETAFGIWMLDNGKGFGESQVKWFESYEVGTTPTVVFEHIPTADIGNLYEECRMWDEAALASDMKFYRINDRIARGHAEGVIEPGKTEQMEMWKKKNVVGAFFGHWHTSGYDGTYQGVTMGMTYGCQFSKAGPYGVRTVTLDENSGKIETELYEYVNGDFVLQSFSPYAEYDNDVDAILAGIKNFFMFIVNAITFALKF